MSALFLLKTLGLFIATAIAEIVGCLFTLPMAQRGSFRLVAHSGSNKLGFICLLINISSSGKRAGLRSLWWYLRVNCHSLAANCR